MLKVQIEGGGLGIQQDAESTGVWWCFLKEVFYKVFSRMLKVQC
jgi:hypothetical protein